MKDIKSTIIGLVVIVAFFWLLPSVGEADTEEVDCSEDTIQEAVDGAEPGDTLLVSGTCNENLRIEYEINRITLDGQGEATIDALDSEIATINVRGRGITIKGFTITGGSSGIFVQRGGEAIVEGNTVQENDTGIQVQRHSSAQIDNSNIIRMNNGNGIVVTDSSAARIEDNTIVDNTRNGVVVNRSSDARIEGNTIDNTGNGVIVLRVSHARIRNNDIEGNGGDGILVQENAGVNVRANSTAPASLNGGFGLRCATGAYTTADGGFGTLTGNLGQTSFGTADDDGTCTDNL